MAHCEPPKEPDALDIALKKVKDKKDELEKDIKVYVDKKAEELIADIREKYLSDTTKEALDFIENILGKNRKKIYYIYKFLCSFVRIFVCLSVPL